MCLFGRNHFSSLLSFSTSWLFEKLVLYYSISFAKTIRLKIIGISLTLHYLTLLLTYPFISLHQHLILLGKGSSSSPGSICMSAIAVMVSLSPMFVSMCMSDTSRSMCHFGFTYSKQNIMMHFSRSRHYFHHAHYFVSYFVIVLHSIYRWQWH